MRRIASSLIVAALMTAAGCGGPPSDQANENAGGPAEEYYTVRAGPIADARIDAVDGTFQMLKVGALEPGGPAKTPEERLQSADKEQLSEMLKHYIVEGMMTSDQLMEQEVLETLQGAKLEVSAAKGGVLVNEIEVLKPDIVAENSVIHVIGGVFAPETADQTGTEQQQ